MNPRPLLCEASALPSELSVFYIDEPNIVLMIVLATLELNIEYLQLYINIIKQNYIYIYIYCVEANITKMKLQAIIEYLCLLDSHIVQNSAVDPMKKNYIPIDYKIYQMKLFYDC